MGLSNDLSSEAGSFSCCRPNPHGHFNQRFEALFPPLWTPEVCGLLRSSAICPGLSVHECGAVGCYPLLCLPRSLPLCHSKSGPLGLSVCECGAAGSASGQTACPAPPTLPHSRSPHGTSPPPLAISAPPTGLDECLFLIFLVSDFLAFRFSVRSGCARRCSVSTYTAILVL